MKQEIARHLLTIGAVAFSPEEPYTWASGIKSPIYCDNRLTMSYPEVRGEVADGLVTLIKQHYPEVEVIAGTATAGIPHAAFVSERMQLPMSYVRSSSKKHGKGNQIEGKVEAGQKVVVVEDLISTGGSAIDACDALKAHGADVLGIVAIFSYQLQKGRDKLTAAGYPYSTLTDFDTLVEEAAAMNKLNQKDIETVTDFRNNL
ncbi:orotate phosphoribosyltransferase [Macrococcus equipercicus]|uniref:Orotate phosphoribosyltransferase n=1 Tax=Macrococcus equipercicus TaxID=69967 RepID=A0A9Q9BSD2_9STAP|nr:orotate phosphoribosyltransferase [Macrococcus equipercicus]KAA1042803.1 orotate phosphoribosyltransferase [Macrococcus equipercicus]UTH14854.1 orotate phosphoribosyltransferase [Macrococcus equipercicus]